MPDTTHLSPEVGTSRWSYLLAGALLLCCTAASLWGWLASARSLAEEADKEFSRYSELTFVNIGQRVQHQIDLLTGFQALFRSGAAVHAQTFHHQYQELQVQARFPGLKAVQYSELVPEPRRQAFEAMVALESGTAYRIHPPGPRPEYMAVRFSEPMLGNEAALGLDTHADGKRRDVADRARDSGLPQASGPIRLVQGQPGLVVRLPLYRHGLPLDTVEQRRVAHSGQITGVLLTDHVLRDVLPAAGGTPFRVTVTDRGLVDAAPSAELPARVEVAHLNGQVMADNQAPPAAQDRREHNLAMAGRLWSVEVARPAVRHALAPLPLAVLGGGLAIGLLLSTVVGRLSWLRQRAHALAWQMSEQARANADRLQAVLNSTADGIVTIGPQGQLLSANRAMFKLFGYREEQLLGHDLTLLLAHDAPTHALPWRAMAAGLPETGTHADGQARQWQARRVDGQVFPVELAINTMLVQGQTHWVGVVSDLSQSVAAQQRIAESMRALQAANELRESVFRHASLALVVTDPEGLVQAMNPAAEQLLGCNAARTIGQQSLTSFVDGADAATMAQMMHRLRETAAADLSNHGPLGIERQAHFQRHNGSRVPVSVTLSALRDGEGHVSGYLSISVDITERQVLAQQLAQLAYHDGLTGLANRIRLEDQLQQAIAQAKDHGQPLALLFIDLDRFKQINDQHGHAVGDQVLCEVARRLQASLRQQDLVARLGGDEFVVLLTTLACDQDAATVADKLINVLSEPMAIGSRQLQVGASVGVSSYPQAGEDAAAMLRAADAAMYRAKQVGRRAMDRLSRSANKV